MSEPFLGEVKLCGFNFAPTGWAECNGQLLPIQQNTALFSLLGTQYGGNGTTNFSLPDLRGRAVISQGNGNVVGQTGGEESVTLTGGTFPTHTHAFNVNNAAANAGRPAAGNVGHYLAQTVSTASPPAPPANLYGAANSLVALSFQPTPVLSAVGGGQPHENRQPFLCMEFAIAIQGIFPARN